MPENAFEKRGAGRPGQPGPAGSPASKAHVRASHTHPDENRLVLTADGPALVSGPVEIELPDGSTIRSDRPVTAICLCRRSKRYPICDTSHRTKVRQREDDTCRA
jgi:CDGSH-type Zn-finger protein